MCSRYSNPTNGHTDFFSSTQGAVTGCGGIPQRGGFGIASNQKVLQGCGPKGCLAQYLPNPDCGSESDLNMGASKSHHCNLKGGKAGGTSYHGFNPTQGEDLSDFRGGVIPVKRGNHGSCSAVKQAGGRKKRKTMHKKRKVHSKKRKTQHKKRKVHSKKRKTMHKKRKVHSKKRKTMHKKQRGGGCAQYMSDLPFSLSYSLGGKLSPRNSALANPPPQNPFLKCPNARSYL